MKFVKKILATLLAFMPMTFVYAEKLNNPLGETSIQELLSKILDAVVMIGLPVLVMAILFVGFMYVKAQGNPEQLKTAHAAFFWTVIGAFVILGAQLISKALCNTATDLGAKGLSC